MLVLLKVEGPQHKGSSDGPQPAGPNQGSANLFTWNRGAWIGMGYKAVFAANIGNICKNTNAADRPSQGIRNRAE